MVMLRLSPEDIDAIATAVAAKLREQSEALSFEERGVAEARELARRPLSEVKAYFDDLARRQRVMRLMLNASE